MYKNGHEKIIYLIEMTVPWMGNREDKYTFKHNKYNDILQNLKPENPESKVGQIALVRDVFGVYGADLRRTIKRVIPERTIQESVINNMQKSVLSSVSNVSRRIKVKVM